MTAAPQPIDPIIRACQPAELDTLAALARHIWQHHYPAMISRAQIDYMLAQRYSHPVLLAALEAPHHWLDGLWLNGQMAGFVHYCLQPDSVMKLEKLYLDPHWHGQGLGSQLLQYVAARSRQQDCTRLSLAVNKQNHLALQAYRRNGFVVAESVCQPIGEGFVMDDYLMQLHL